MEFIALILAIIALVLALKARSRITLLEHNLGLATKRVEGGSPAAAATPAEEPRPASPLEVFASRPAAPAEPQAARTAESDIEQIIAEGSQPLSPPPEPPAPAKSFEERFGASWVVWIGGLALALGGIFLVQYSIEAGLIGPGVRVFLGGLLAAALIAAGEWTRRREIAIPLAQVPTAHIPSILTAAGTTVAYATIYAAYALYGFLVPGTAFVLLGIVALATLAAALLHGPALAALGQVGAFLAPMLVASDTPNYWALYLYLAIVTAASFALARARLWRWLAITAVAFGTLWMLPGLNDTIAAGSIGAHAFHAVAGFALVAALLVSGLFYGPDAEAGDVDGVSSGALAAYLFGATLLVLASQHDGVALAVFTLLIVGTVAIAWRTDAAVASLPFAGVFTFLVMANWAVHMNFKSLVAAGGPAALPPDPSPALYGTHLALGFALMALFAAAGFLAQGRSVKSLAPIIWAATAAAAPLAILIALYYRIYVFDRSLPFAALALLIAALFGYATELLGKREPRPGSASAAAIFATGSIAALALALTFALEKGWLTVALALMVPGTAWIAEKRPLPWLRWLCGILVALVMARIAWEPRIVTDVGTMPIFNWILYGYGIPAIAFWAAGFTLRKRADDTPTRMVEAGAVLFTVLCAFLEIRHYVYSGDIYYPIPRLNELALDVCGGLALSIGLERLRERTHSVVHDVAAQIITGLTLLTIALGLFVIENPLLGVPVGGPFINLILLGYGLPAILMAALALTVRGKRPQIYSTVYAVAAVALALAYLSLTVTRLYHGPVLSAGEFSDAEGYTYSAVWLAFGVALLLVGIALRSQPVRLCSAAVVLLTVGKVFLVDMGGLTGVWRALSFIGLGLVLVGIGYLYQRLLFRKPPQAQAMPAS